MTNQTDLTDFVKATNQGENPELYEVENLALDREGTVWDALQRIAPWEGKTILDLGCGSGFWLPRYAEAAAETIGVEPDPDLLPEAESRTPGARVLSGSAEHIPLPDASVDVVHARFAYFFPMVNNDCTAGLEEVLRVLEPGGTFVVIDNDHQHGEFADLLAKSPWAIAGQGEERFINEWWAGHGADRTEVMSSWTLDSESDLRDVLHLEFPADVVNPWLEAHPGRTRLTYGYVLHHLKK
ncbi:class I SAM-dependent methyltransferase [Arthrobacter roseus]|uniref:class I SAM-dependent methyltransferase n=1 Tax=Arthrobacter roseus TaxID=136274 RepID=UPI0019628266|nr:class I SAM-dependent methyltransferase [Arthrobacter roseus]MBM7847064.1 SAM-dependent methyltransferase [Arthrobacter roseus]